MFSTVRQLFTCLLDSLSFLDHAHAPNHLSLISAQELKRVLLRRDLELLELLQAWEYHDQHPTDEPQHVLLAELLLPHVARVQQLLLQVDAGQHAIQEEIYLLLQDADGLRVKLVEIGYLILSLLIEHRLLHHLGRVHRIPHHLKKHSVRGYQLVVLPGTLE